MTDDEWFEQRRRVLANRKQRGCWDVGVQKEAVGKTWRPNPYRRAEPLPVFTPPAGAACLGTTEIFYDEEHGHALEACRQCPAHWPCRYAAIEVPTSNQYGVQGGLTAEQRVEIRRQWTRIDTTVMRYRRAEALDQSWALRQETRAA